MNQPEWTGQDLLVSSAASVRWVDSQVVISAPTGSRSVVTEDSSVLLLLHAFSKPATVDEVASCFPDIPRSDVDSVVVDLVDQGILTRLDSIVRKPTPYQAQADAPTILFVVPPNLGRYGDVSIPTGIPILAGAARARGYACDFLFASTVANAGRLSRDYLVVPDHNDVPVLRVLEHFTVALEDRIQAARDVGARLVVAISCFTSALYLASAALATSLRARFDDLVLIVGGYHPTIDASSLLSPGLGDVVLRAAVRWGKVAGEYSERVTRAAETVAARGDFAFDYIFVGRSENTLPDLLTELLQKFCRPCEAQIVRASPASTSRFSDFEYDREVLSVLAGSKQEADLRPEPMFPLCFSLGCPHRCNFCVNSRGHSAWDPLDARRAVEVLEFLHVEHGIAFFPLADANFGVDHKWWRRFFDLLRGRPWATRIRLTAETSIASIPLHDVDLLDGLSVSLQVGVESCSGEILARMEKTRTPGRYLQRLKRIVSIYGSRLDSLQLMLIVGYPGETKRTLRETFSWLIDDCRVLEYPSVALLAQIFLPLQGTAACDRSEEHREKLGFISSSRPWWEEDACDRFDGLRPSHELTVEDCSAVVRCLGSYYDSLLGESCVMEGSRPWTRLGRTRFRDRLFDLLK